MDTKPTLLYHTEQASKPRQEILRTSMDVALERLSIGRLPTFRHSKIPRRMAGMPRCRFGFPEGHSSTTILVLLKYEPADEWR
jgi:hypothetical protein